MSWWRPPTVGLRGRIAWGVFVAVLLSSAAASGVAYAHLAHRATTQFHEQAHRQAASDVSGAENAAQTAGSSTSGTPADVDLGTVFQASFQTFFQPGRTYAVVVLKPGPGDTYTLVSKGPGDDNGDTDTLHRKAPDALVAATPFAEFVTADGSGDLVSREIDVDGHWLAIGGQTARGSAPGYFRAPVVAVDYIDLTPLRTQVADLRTSLLAVTGTAALIAAAFAWLLAGVIQRPVRRVAVVARRFGHGDRSVRLPVRGRDAVAELAEDFNTMADELTATVTSLEASERRQRAFVADVAHELRTPMTALVAGAAALEDATTRDRAATLVAAQVRRLGRLTEDLVETSLLDDGTARVEREPVDVHAVALDVVAHCDDPGSVRVTGGGDAVADVDPRRVHTVLRNLVANALRHGAPPVQLHVSGDDSVVRVTVDDQGPGIPAELGDRLFERFVRGDPSRSGPGTGLGLSLARENAEITGGSLSSADRGGDGARFVLTVPREAPTATGPHRQVPAVVVPPEGSPPSDDGRGPHRRWALTAAAAGLVVGGVLVAAVTGARSNYVPTVTATVTATPGSDASAVAAYRELFGPAATVLASNSGPEGTTIELLQADDPQQGTCTTVSVSTPSADRQPSYSCDPPGTPTDATASGFGGSWSWVSPTSGLRWSGWFAEGSRATTVELRVDDQVVATATPVAGAYVLPPVQDTRPGCRTVVSRDATGAVVQVEYTDLTCDPAFRTTAPGADALSR